MSRYGAVPVKGQDLSRALKKVVAALIEGGVVDAVLVPCHGPHGAVVQTLIDKVTDDLIIDPLAPVAATSGATQLARITRRSAGAKVAAFLSPCEVRAFVELTKLKQASLEGVLLIGTDCLGRFENRDYAGSFGQDEGSTAAFLAQVARGPAMDLQFSLACRSCQTPEAAGVDLRLITIGVDPLEELLFEAITPAGEAALEACHLEDRPTPEARSAQLEEIIESKKAYQRLQVKSIPELLDVLAGCVGCRNCRTACPICYCRECTLATETFDHDGRHYLSQAVKRGQLRMPADVLLFHLTRMAHVSSQCVKCGQCTSACPNDIPLSDLFSAAADAAQSVFDYFPGADPTTPQPLAHFEAEELGYVTGQVK